jgi:hypothetical protein
MKKSISMFLLVLFAASLTACATMNKDDGVQRVKCPACGFEFDPPSERK